MGVIFSYYAPDMGLLARIDKELKNTNNNSINNRSILNRINI
jgi:hypothetical protein